MMVCGGNKALASISPACMRYKWSSGAQWEEPGEQTVSLLGVQPADRGIGLAFE